VKPNCLIDKNVSEATELQEQTREKGEKAAENIRYGQNISESGVGGKTTKNQGTANQGIGRCRKRV
jgi:hypothetical protein